MPKLLKSKHFLPPDTHTCVYVSGGKKCLFFGHFGVLSLLETPVLRFALLPYSRRFNVNKEIDARPSFQELNPLDIQQEKPASSPDIHAKDQNFQPFQLETTFSKHYLK